MTTRVFGNDFKSGELADTTKFQPFAPKKNIIVDQMGTWIIIFNDPTFTDLKMNIFASSGGTPSTLIAAATNTRTKANIHTLDNAVKYIGYTFDNVPLQTDTTYHIVLSATGYSPTSTKFIAWRQGASQSEITYDTGITADLTKIAVQPYMIIISGAEY